VKRKPVSEQVVGVFGATSGMGLLAALMLAERGARLVLAGRSRGELERVVEQARSRGAEAYAVAADAKEWEQVKSVADEALARFGRLDTWVHVASVDEWALFEDLTPDEYRQIIEVNLLGQVYGAMAALPVMLHQGEGGLIHVGSIAGKIPLPLQNPYAAAKHGLTAFVESLRMELEHYGRPVHITHILPMGINTSLFEKARTRMGVQPQPLPPAYSPEEAAKAIVYAVEHPRGEIIVGGTGALYQWLYRLSPRLTQKGMHLIAFSGQKSPQEKSAQAPSNLYEHLDGFQRVEGEYRHLTRPFSLYTWLALHPPAAYALIGGLLAAAGALVFTRGGAKNS